MVKIKKSKLLLHICCAGCGAYVSQLLSRTRGIDVCLFFYNPNIFPENEYKKRLDEVRMISKKYKVDLLIGEYNHQSWLEKVRGHENDQEKGERCQICYFERIKMTAETARLENCDFFTTTLTVSPHKLAKKIIEIGEKLAEENKIKFLSEDFKKNNGFKEALALSKKIGLYRQNYCGCEFSQR